MNEIQVFQYESNEIRVVEKPDGPWWVLSDVCRVLDVANPRNISARLDEDEKGVHQIDTPGGKPTRYFRRSAKRGATPKSP